MSNTEKYPLPLIAPKSFREQTPEHFHTHVKAMYEERKKAATKPKKPSFAEGLSLKRTKTGKVSITRNKKKRGFEFVLDSEIDSLAKGYEMTKAEVWNAFKAKKYIIARTSEEAKTIKANVEGVPW